MEHTAAILRELKRIASENPETRKHLLPLIRQAHSKKAWGGANKANLKRAYSRLKGHVFKLDKNLEELIKYGRARARDKDSKHPKSVREAAVAALVKMKGHLDRGWDEFKKNDREILEYVTKTAGYGYERATRELKNAREDLGAIISYLDQMLMAAQAEGNKELVKKLDRVSTQMYLALNTYTKNLKIINLLTDGF